MNDYPNTILHQTITRLTELSASNLEQLFQISTQRHFSKGDIILKQGAICKSILFVEKGCLRTFMDRDGLEINTSFTFEGAFITNLKSLRTAAPSDTTIQASEPTTLYEFDKDQLLELYQVSPEIESFGRKLLEQLLITQEEHSNLFKIFSPTERYQYLLRNQPELLQRVSLSHLASYLGIARETLSRIRKNKA